MNERSAFASLARTLNRLGVRYAQWAKEAESAGKRDDYRKYLDAAAAKFSDARWYLGAARRR